MYPDYWESFVYPVLGTKPAPIDVFPKVNKGFSLSVLWNLDLPPVELDGLELGVADALCQECLHRPFLSLSSFAMPSSMVWIASSIATFLGGYSSSFTATSKSSLVTGSEIQILEEFLGFNDKHSPLYKREHEIVHLDRFSRGESAMYLKEGFKEVSLSVSDKEIENTVEVLDGIVGWLREYGWLRYRGKTHSEAIDEVFQKAKSDIIDELSRYSPRYLTIMMAISEGYHSWSAIKAYVERSEGKRIDKKTLYTALRNLTKYGYIEKRDDEHYIVDPVIERALRHAR